MFLFEEAYPSIAWTIASIPVDAVVVAGRPRVSSGSKIAKSGNIIGEDTPFFYSSPTVIIDTGVTEIDEIEDSHSLDTMDHQTTLEQSSAVNENVALESFLFFEGGLLLEETDGDNILHENDSTSVGEWIILETKLFS